MRSVLAHADLHDSAYLIPLLVGVVMQHVSIKQFNADRKSFLP
jgi:hypothetical protein